MNHTEQNNRFHIISPSILPYVVLVFSALALLYRSRLGFCWSDETFYFSTCDRFFQGDGVFLHEWFPTQLSSVLLLPLYSMYLTLTGSSDGIIIFFRVCYVCVSFCIALFLYRTFQKEYSPYTALCCSLFYMFYAHLNIATLSYYTMSVSFCLVSMILIYRSLKTDCVHPKSVLILAGVFFAGAVVSLPTLTLPYVFASIVLLAVSFYKKDLRLIFPYTLIGICLLATIYLSYVLSHVTIMDLLNNLPYVLSDEEHTTNMIDPFKKFFLSVSDVFGPVTIISCLSILFTAFYGRKLKDIYKAILAMIQIPLAAYYIFCSLGHTGYINAVLLLFGLPFYFMTVKRNKPLLFLLYGSGLSLSMVYSYSSNGYLYIMTLGHSLCAIGAFLFLFDFLKEFSSSQINGSLRKTILILCTAITLLSVAQTMTLRMVNIYRDAPLSDLSSKMDAGPAKGLYTTSLHATRYYEVYQALLSYASGEGNIFITKLLPWGYLVTDMNCGAPTTWRTSFDSKRLPLYYAAHPERIPDVIFVVNEEYGSYETCGDVEADPIPNKNAIGGFLKTYAEEHDYKIIDVGCGTVYQRADR